MRTLQLNGVKQSCDLKVVGELPSLRRLSLEFLAVDNGSQVSLAPLSGHPTLESLKIESSGDGFSILKLSDVVQLATIPNLEYLKISSQTPDYHRKRLVISGTCELGGLLNKQAVTGYQRLYQLEIVAENQMMSLGVFSNTPQLRLLALKHCVTLVNLGPAIQFPSLESVEIVGCKSLRTIDGLQSATELKKISLAGCDAIVNLDELKNAKSLTQVVVDRCDELMSIQGMPVNELKWVRILDNKRLESMTLLGQTRNLEVLSIWGCPQTTELEVHSDAKLKNFS